MKKLLMFLMLVGIVRVAHADELSSIYSINKLLHYENASVTTSTQIIAIDLSDTSTYPTLERNGSLAISKAHLSFIATPAVNSISSGTIQLGVVTYVNNSTGTVSWFASYPYYGASTATVTFNDLIAPMYTRTYVKKAVNADGTTFYFGSNNTTSGSTAYQNDLLLPTALGTSAFPAIGDIILNINIGVGTISRLVLDLRYTGLPQ